MSWVHYEIELFKCWVGIEEIEGKFYWVTMNVRKTSRRSFKLS